MRLTAEGRRFRTVAELTQNQVQAAMLIYHILRQRAALGVLFGDEDVDRLRLLVDQDDPNVHALEIHRKGHGWDAPRHALRCEEAVNCRGRRGRRGPTHSWL